MHVLMCLVGELWIHELAPRLIKFRRRDAEPSRHRRVGQKLLSQRTQVVSQLLVGVSFEVAIPLFACWWE